MSVGLFWLGIILKRIPGFIKKYPAIFVFSLTLLSSLFIFDIVRLSLTQEQYNILLCIIMLLVFVKSFKYFDIIPVLIRYSNTKITTKGIINRCLLKKAIFNCTPYFIFCGCIILRLVTLDFSYNGFVFLTRTIFLLFLISLCILCLRFSYNKIFAAVCGVLILISIILSINIARAFGIIMISLLIIDVILLIYNNPPKKTEDKYTVNLRVGSIVKSSIYDFFCSGFLYDTIFVISLFLVLLWKIIIDKQIDDNIMLIALFLSVGYVSFIDVFSGINWRFYAIVKMDFKYQIKRGVLFLCCIYGIPLIIFLSIYGATKTGHLFFPLFGYIGMMFLSVGLSFMDGNIILRGLLGLAIAWFMVIYSQFNWYVIFSFLPVIIVILKAKNDFTKLERL